MGEPADGAVEKILVLIELHDVMAWDGVRHHPIPGLVLLRVKLVHGRGPSWRQVRAAFPNSPGPIPRSNCKRRSKTSGNCGCSRERCASACAGGQCVCVEAHTLTRRRDVKAASDDDSAGPLAARRLPRDQTW